MTSSNKSEPSAIVVPFGKHKGATVAELLVKDPAYADWIIGQGWVAERFAELHAAILTRGAGTDDTPEHNVIQARFLDPVFRAAVMLAARAGEMREWEADKRKWDLEGIKEKLSSLISGQRWRPSEDYQTQYDALAEKIGSFQENKYKLWTGIRFEQRGVDAIIDWGIGPKASEAYRHASLGVEIKPTMGDDYPTVLRQMSALAVKVLILGEYSGRGVSLPQVRQMFEANSMMLLLVRDVEAELPNVRAET